MCGFAGFTGQTPDNASVIQNMMNKIIHRGPDSAGVYADERITLGFRRLSIIDLSDDGAQPIYNEDRSVAVVFNGEIYNYQELRRDLEALGHTFYTHTDTETLVHLYEEHGKKMLGFLRGMFAFAIYDKTKDELFAARDFFGVKPFYYTVRDKKDIVFASEIKAILEYPGFQREVNPAALENYMTFQYSVLPETFFKNVYKLQPGHYLTFKDGRVSVTRYFKVEFTPDEAMTEAEAEESIDRAVLDSIAAHKISDVEVGSFLSSGVDSSYVAACAGGARTFTVGFENEQYNEISYAKDLSKKIRIDNYSKTISADEYWAALPKVQYHMDEPLADPSAVPLYFLAQLAAHYVKVALSGEAADEFFGGYNIYQEPLDLARFRKIPLWLRKALASVAAALPFSFRGKSFLIRASKSIEARFIGNAYMFTPRERERLLRQPSSSLAPNELTKQYYDEAAGYDEITKMQYVDIHMWLVGDILLKADKMSMAHSLEVRVPFVDKRVFECAAKVPTRLRVAKTGTKLSFRRAALRHIPLFTANKKKLGFPVPIRVWLREEKYYHKVHDAFTGKTAQAFFYTEGLLKLLSDHKKGRADNSRKIWTVYMFLVWHEAYFG